MRANDLNENFDCVTNVKAPVPEKSNQTIVERVRNDEADFPELKAQFEPEKIEEGDPQSMNDIQYLLRFERGEKEYDYLRNKKGEQYNSLAKKKVDDFRST